MSPSSPTTGKLRLHDAMRLHPPGPCHIPKFIPAAQAPIVPYFCAQTVGQRWKRSLGCPSPTIPFRVTVWLFTCFPRAPWASLVLPSRATPPDRGLSGPSFACSSHARATLARKHWTPGCASERAAADLRRKDAARRDAHPLRTPTFAVPSHPTWATLPGSVGLGSGTSAQTGTGVISWRQHYA